MEPVSGVREPPGPEDPRHDLRVALRDLYLQAGKPSLRAIAKATGKEISYDTVRRILKLKGKRLPRWRPVELVVQALNGDVEAFQVMWIAAARREEDDGKRSD